MCILCLPSREDKILFFLLSSCINGGVDGLRLVFKTLVNLKLWFAPPVHLRSNLHFL